MRRNQMSNAKIEFTFGSLSFSGEGEEDWLAKQLDKILNAAPTLSELHAPSVTPEAQTPVEGTSGADKPEPLSSHIKAKGGETNQTKRFLATADWLRMRGTTPLTTKAVTKALLDNHQKKLTNAANCLNQNVSKGFCEKGGGGFFITPHGLRELGHQT
jgi:hypothetical protein